MLIWKKNSGQSLDEIELTRGVYRLSFDVRYIPDFLLPRSMSSESLSFAGKTVKVVSWRLEDQNSRGVLTLEVVENPLPLVAIILGLSVLGITGAFLLDSVERVLDSVGKTVSSPPVFLLILGVVGFLLLPYFRAYRE